MLSDASRSVGAPLGRVIDLSVPAVAPPSRRGALVLVAAVAVFLGGAAGYVALRPLTEQTRPAGAAASWRAVPSAAPDVVLPMRPGARPVPGAESARVRPAAKRR